MAGRGSASLCPVWGGGGVTAKDVGLSVLRCKEFSAKAVGISLLKGFLFGAVSE